MSYGNFFLRVKTINKSKKKIPDFPVVIEVQRYFLTLGGITVSGHIDV